MNNNRSDERALQAGCKGVFSTAGYITIGTKGCALPSAPHTHARAVARGRSRAHTAALDAIKRRLTDLRGQWQPERRRSAAGARPNTNALRAAGSTAWQVTAAVLASVRSSEPYWGYLDAREMPGGRRGRRQSVAAAIMIALHHCIVLCAVGARARPLAAPGFAPALRAPARCLRPRSA